MDITRRTALAVLGAGAGAVGLATGAHGHAGEPQPAPAAGPWSSTAVETTTLGWFDAGFTAETLAEVPRVLEVRGLTPSTPALAGVLVFDPRLLARRGDVMLSSTGRVWTVPVTEHRTAEGATELRFALTSAPDAAPHDAPTLVLLPLVPRALYPAENLPGVVPLALALTGGAGEYRWADVSTTTPREPWGAELAAAWTSCGVGPARSYRFPVGVRVAGVGPGPVPAGARLTVDLDARLVAAVAASELRLDGTPVDRALADVSSTRVGDLLRTVVQLRDQIPADAVLDVALDVTPTGSAHDVAGLHYATVTLAGLDDATRPPRATGRYSVSDLTSSGTPHAESATCGTT
ncbi:hypothetical protein [Cellulomonas cellasea]|uniref:Uncharacterized protein n=2 Tax=Cellulomonas cellasea TaxID=43670 RepID=A0A0A0B800_9CELL|nr:hypothetical protein [Cellulomonas cellasea]KGM01924.1 hypothetical protein Q760_16550 [Cellulomonas cellasea DSM 20118]GEA86593.1 hypothetical protein CCE01nite_05420 [Cellulomonas cellasea]